MTNKEKLEKVYDFVKSQEDYFYKPIEDGKHEPGSIAAMQCVFQASSFQKVRYFMEDIMEEGEEKLGELEGEVTYGLKSNN